MRRAYLGWALAALALTVAAGTWLRIALLQPAALGPLEFRHAVHAHSHVALFGWTTMAMFAFVVGVAGRERPWMRLHAHAVGIAAAAAFAGFLAMGYAGPTIGVSIVHVLLWWTFAALAWRGLDDAPPLVRRYLRAALAFLVLAGLGAMTPAIVLVRGVPDLWYARLAVELFLAPFLEGWLALGVAAVVYARAERPRFARLVLPLVAIGTMPAALLRVLEPPPASWLPLVGRIGTVLLGMAAVLLSLDLLRRAGPTPLLRLAGLGLLAEGLLEIGVALAADATILGSQQLKVAYLHLDLLGVVTPLLLGAVAFPSMARRTEWRVTVVHGAGLAVTLAALGAMGWSRAAALVAGIGMSFQSLMLAALVGGAMSATAVLSLVVAPRLEQRQRG